MMLDRFLSSKPLYSNKIDFDFFPTFYKKYEEYFTLPKAIHIVGTNGKGSSGRFLAQMLLGSGYRVGHYTSPHILSFNERIWIDGDNIKDEKLEEIHIELLEILKSDAELLSYFEYTTLLAFLAFKNLDYVVVEAGLGGEFDATNVIKKELLLCTKIDMDHKDFLGESIEKIGRTKLNAMDSAVLLGEQEHKEIIGIAKEIAMKKNSKVYLVEDLIDDTSHDEIVAYIKKNNMADFQIQNLSNSVAAMKILKLPISLQHILLTSLEGRCQKINDNITIDVGHNLLGAKAIKSHFYGKKVNLIYNVMSDKDYESILEELRPIIKKVMILKLDTPRALDIKILGDFLHTRGFDFEEFCGIKKDEEYLVFGSFYTVEKFLRLHKEGLI